MRRVDGTKAVYPRLPEGAANAATATLRYLCVWGVDKDEKIPRKTSHVIFALLKSASGHF